MIDQNSQFMAILTAVGEAKQANAAALGIPWTFSQMGIGDASGSDPQPDRAQTKLINEQRRAPLNQVRTDPKNANVIIAEQVIPENVGGWWIREIGLYDAEGDLVAVANCAPSFKPLLAQGSGKTQVVRINFIVTSAANVTLKIDPSVVLATRQYVDDQIIEVLPPTRMAGTFRKVTINEHGVVIAGSNPDTLAGAGIKDAIANINPLSDGSLDLHGGNYAFVTARLESHLTRNAYWDGAKWLSHNNNEPSYRMSCLSNGFSCSTAVPVNGPLLWISTPIATGLDLAKKANSATTLAGYGITDAYTQIKTNDLLKVKAPLASPALTGKPTAPTASVGANDLQLANTAFVQAIAAGMNASAPGDAVFTFSRLPPVGTLKANGAAVPVANYPALTTAIYVGDVLNASAVWGYRCNNATAPSTTRATNGPYIVLPDVRGESVVGFDDGRGVDAGRDWASWQDWMVGSHTHPVRYWTYRDGTGTGFHNYLKPFNDKGSSTGTQEDGVGASGGNTNRSRNLAPLACIRY